MARWKLGASDVEALMASGELQKLTGDAANGEKLLAKAAVTLETARSAIESEPHSVWTAGALARQVERHQVRSGGEHVVRGRQERVQRGDWVGDVKWPVGIPLLSDSVDDNVGGTWRR